MKSKLFSGIKQFWQLIIYNRHFLSQEETEAADFRFSILIFGEQSKVSFPVIYSSISNSKEIVSLNSSMACGREGHVKREMIATKFICPSILPSAV